MTWSLWLAFSRRVGRQYHVASSNRTLVLEGGGGARSLKSGMGAGLCAPDPDKCNYVSRAIEPQGARMYIIYININFFYKILHYKYLCRSPLPTLIFKKYIYNDLLLRFGHC